VTIRATIRKTRERPIAVRGLLDRTSIAPSAGPPPGAGPFPAFAFSEPVVIPPGETGEARFTPTEEVTSFVYGQTLPPGAGAEAASPQGTFNERSFMGALVIDPAGTVGDVVGSSVGTTGRDRARDGDGGRSACVEDRIGDHGQLPPQATRQLGTRRSPDVGFIAIQDQGEG
jgi:hypothetical protein